MPLPKSQRAGFERCGLEPREAGSAVHVPLRACWAPWTCTACHLLWRVSPLPSTERRLCSLTCKDPCGKSRLQNEKTTSVWLWTRKNYRNHLFFAHQLWWLNYYKNQTWKAGLLVCFSRWWQNIELLPHLPTPFLKNSEQRTNLLVLILELFAACEIPNVCACLVSRPITNLINLSKCCWALKIAMDKDKGG